MLPGDFVEAVPGQAVTGEAMAAFRKILGPGKPVRFPCFEGVAGAVQGDLEFFRSVAQHRVWTGPDWSWISSLPDEASRSEMCLPW